MSQIDHISESPTEILARIRTEVGKVIIGHDYLIERLMVALLSHGHVLVEGVPGLAKTKTLQAITRTIAASMQRVQFTPDLLPSDIIGTEVYRPQTGEFLVRKGPVFCNVLLADEINRAPAKVQSALLQAMQERTVTIGLQHFKLEDPFLVLATQNPLEQEGTYPLPEAQIDRFLMKIIVSYPSFDEEVALLSRAHLEASIIEPVISQSQLLALMSSIDSVYVDPAIDRYIVQLIQATRAPETVGLRDMVAWGSSPRGSVALRTASQALALLRGRAYVTPDEIKSLAPDILRHRVAPSFEGEGRGLTSDNIVSAVLKIIPSP